MRKLTTLVCFISFFTLQYSKVVSYYHCRIVNTLQPTKPCDCEKQLTDQHDHSSNHSSTALIKEKVEEVYCMPCLQQPQVPATIIAKKEYLSYTVLLPESIAHGIFRPPCC